MRRCVGAPVCASSLQQSLVLLTATLQKSLVLALCTATMGLCVPVDFATEATPSARVLCCGCVDALVFGGCQLLVWLLLPACIPQLPMYQHITHTVCLIAHSCLGTGTVGRFVGSWHMLPWCKGGLAQVMCRNATWASLPLMHLLVLVIAAIPIGHHTSCSWRVI